MTLHSGRWVAARLRRVAARVVGKYFEQTEGYQYSMLPLSSRLSYHTLHAFESKVKDLLCEFAPLLQIIKK